MIVEETGVSGLVNSEFPPTEFTNSPNSTTFSGIHRNSSHILRPTLERAKMTKFRSCGQSNTVVKHCSAAAACRRMAGYGIEGRFKLISAAPLVNGREIPTYVWSVGSAALCSVVARQGRGNFGSVYSKEIVGLATQAQSESGNCPEFSRSSAAPNRIREFPAFRMPNPHSRIPN